METANELKRELSGGVFCAKWNSFGEALVDTEAKLMLAQVEKISAAGEKEMNEARERGEQK